jgi:hypothetical protein
VRRSAITIPNTGGRFDFINARFSEVGNELRMYGCDGVNRAFEFDGTTFAPITSAFTTDAPQAPHVPQGLPLALARWLGDLQQSG